MKISIIGTNGFLSVVIAKYFYSLGWDVNMFGLEEPTRHAYNNFYKTDLLKNKLDYDRLMDAEIIIYAAGAGIQSNLKEGAGLIYSLNVSVPVGICNRLKSDDFRGTFVSFGSVFEMGQTNERRTFTEEDLLASRWPAPNDYAVSKRMLSRYIDGYAHSFTHWHFFIPTIYGESENPARLIPYTINAITHGEIMNFTSGEQVRSYIYVNEIPEIIMRSYQKQLPSGCYNIGGKDTLSVKEIVTLVHHYFGRELPEECFGHATRSDAVMKYLELDGSRLYGLIDYFPSTRIEDVIPKYLSSWSENSPKSQD